MMPAEAWLTVGVAVVAVACMARDWLDPPAALGGALGLLLILGVLTPATALSGFSNPAVATVAMLLILGTGLEGSPWLKWVTSAVFGDRPGRPAILRSSGAVAALSAFVANTPVVAALIPAGRDWAEAHDEGVQKLMMPLSFAAILGGTCTLVGTSTNLVVHGMLLSAGDPGFGMFELGRAGLPLALLGIGYLAIFAYRLLPDRGDLLEEARERPREYAARLGVDATSPLVGRSVASLRQLKGVYLAGIERDGTLTAPVSPDSVIEANDRLVFVGLVRRIADLVSFPGVRAEIGKSGSPSPDFLHLIEVVVSPSAPVAGRTIRESGFRGRYDAVVVAVHRQGERIMQRIGDIELRPGDTLLLRTGPDFLTRWQDSRDFYLVSHAGEVRPPVHPGDWLEPLVLMAVVGTASLGWIPLLESSIAGVLLLIVSRRIRPRELWTALDWKTLVTIATAIGLGGAMVESGAAAAAAGAFGAWAGEADPAYVVAGVFLVTALLTEVITNVAAAALMFPVALAVTQDAGLLLHPFAAAIALGASAAFLTPVGYQTNTMVAGAAGYTFGDFARVGFPLKLVYALGGAVLIPMAWPVR